MLPTFHRLDECSGGFVISWLSSKWCLANSPSLALLSFIATSTFLDLSSSSQHYIVYPGETPACQRWQRSTIGAGLAGVPLPTNLTLDEIHSWIRLNVYSEQFSSASSPALLERESLADRMSTIWLKVQSQRPQVKWLCASGQTFSLTPGMTNSDGLTNCAACSWRVIVLLIQRLSNSVTFTLLSFV